MAYRIVEARRKMAAKAFVWCGMIISPNPWNGWNVNVKRSTIVSLSFYNLGTYFLRYSLIWSRAIVTSYGWVGRQKNHWEDLRAKHTQRRLVVVAQLNQAFSSRTGFSRDIYHDELPSRSNESFSRITGLDKQKNTRRLFCFIYQGSVFEDLRGVVCC